MFSLYHPTTLCLLAMAGLTQACGVEGPTDASPEGTATENATAAPLTTVSLRTPSGQRVRALNGGGSILDAVVTDLAAGTKLRLHDVNGGALRNGDQVHLQVESGLFVAAENGGGGALNANRAWAREWETYTLVRVAGSGQARPSTYDPALIEDGEWIALRTWNGKHWVSARSPGALDATGTWHGATERFQISVVEERKSGLSAPFAYPDQLTRPLGIDYDGVAYTYEPWHCTAFNGALDFPHCYDQHTGLDYILRGWYPDMDLSRNPVVAAASGTVVEVADGNVDHCFPGLRFDTDRQIVCPGTSKQDANYVVIRQDDGLLAYYFHLKRDSVVVDSGQRVACGDELGQVGSSGISSTPHLHFELRRLRAGQWANDQTFAENLWNMDLVDADRENLWAATENGVPLNVCPDPANSPVCQLVPICSNALFQQLCVVGNQIATGSCALTGRFGFCLQTCGQVCGMTEQCN